MRTKSLVQPATARDGDEWLSPDGYSPAFRRVRDGDAWVPEASRLSSEEDEDAEEDGEEEDSEESEDSGEDETGEKSPDGSTSETDVTKGEDQSDEGMQAAVSDSNGGEQGASGKPVSQSQQRGKRGEVRKGRKGK